MALAEKDGVSISSLARRLEVSKATMTPLLRRLEEKGWITGRDGGASARRGGRSKRCFVLSDEGLVRLRESRDTLMGLWSDAGEALS